MIRSFLPERAAGQPRKRPIHSHLIARIQRVATQRVIFAGWP
jgi:hypothetical protein